MLEIKNKQDSPELLKHINSAIRILKMAEFEAETKYNEPVEICYSGGKDSDVLLNLAQQAQIKYRAIYKNTTIDPQGTKRHVLENNVEIVNPKFSFFKLIEKKGFPSFTRRFCCETLKEYKILNVACIGVRRAESTKRKGRYKSFEQCRIYKNKERVRQYYPLLDWDDSLIEEYINKKQIKVHPLYYDDKGNFIVKRRLGCVGCPLKQDRGKKDFQNNPKILKAYLKAGKRYWLTHKTRYENVYDVFICLLFFKNYENFLLAKTGGMFPEFGFDSKKKIEEIFNIKLDD